ncbi:MAG: DUF5916 domain-containing protein [Bacteroidetes bacterium]|jgi:hypothetical protein|nr:DUF5916 domain-containing protein [Bacteroidota bacterium]
MPRLLLLSCLLIFFPILLEAQNKKSVAAQRVAERPELDGMLNEDIWQSAETASGFIQREPLNGRPATFDTEVRILYDDKAIYVGAYIIDPQPDSLWIELKSRDNLGLADYFGIILDPYNDGLNGMAFFVSVRNVQVDFKTNAQNQDDYSWDAVWRSATQIVAGGWVAEMMIPYSALRFPKKDVQQWGLNFQRNIQRKREVSSWNFIDATVSGNLQQAGVLTAIENIKPPLRLSGTPYLSAYTEHNSATDQWQSGYNYGMDIKAGLSESFTLDVTLIPDFGQVESDDRIFSLSPYEVYYEEKRPFFTEGTELFSKGNVFYSRRIGSKPEGYNSINRNYETDEIIDNPDASQLINAIKLSGKTGSGLGIGIFNAMTANTYATVLDSNQTEQSVLTSPFTNYNMLVFDQSLKNNSSVSFYNTSVYRPENRFAANVSGTDFRLRDKTNNYELAATINISQHYTKDDKARFGEYALINVGKVSGNFLAETWFKYVSDDYDPNDMGFLNKNNEIANGYNFKYNIYEPFGNFLRMRSRIFVNHYYLNIPRKFNQLLIGADGSITTKKQFSAGFDFSFRPLGFHDHFEPRVPGYEYFTASSYSVGLWTSPDYRKKFLVDFRFGFWHVPSQELFNWWTSIEPRWRVSNNLMVIPEINIDYSFNNIGYVTDSLNSAQKPAIIFGRRDIKEVTTSLEADYAFSPNTSLAFRMRHYWLRVDYLSFYDLNTDGHVYPNNYSRNEDFAVNAFNVDMVFKWNFAPGSELLLIWKNAVYSNENLVELENQFFHNLRNTFEAPIGNSLSIKLLYYLDWQYFKSGSSKSESSYPLG